MRRPFLEIVPVQSDVGLLGSSGFFALLSGVQAEENLFDATLLLPPLLEADVSSSEAPALSEGPDRIAPLP